MQYINRQIKKLKQQGRTILFLLGFAKQYNGEFMKIVVIRRYN